MSDDRELLELAAKAAGIDATYHSPAFGMTYLVGSDDYPYTESWNPLTNDGDALRLAVKLGLTVDLDYADEYVRVFTVPPNGDPYAATRRAIVRAAAEIGRNMK